MTKIINLYGGPGTGKSTTAAKVFAHLKDLCVNAELVREYAKELAWAGVHIDARVQREMFKEQLRREQCLLGKVDVIVTDSPLLLQVHFSRHFEMLDVASDLLLEIKRYRAETGGHIDVQLLRKKAYNPVGRYQTEVEAIAMDDVIFGLVSATFGRPHVFDCTYVGQIAGLAL